MVYCSSCGINIDKEMKFCNKCGSPIKSISAPLENNFYFTWMPFISVIFILLAILFLLMEVILTLVNLSFFGFYKFLNFFTILKIILYPIGFLLGLKCIFLIYKRQKYEAILKYSLFLILCGFISLIISNTGEKIILFTVIGIIFLSFSKNEFYVQYRKK